MPANKTPVEVPTDAEPKFNPIFGKVVVKIDEQPERKYGSLVLPQRSAMAATMGRVHAVYAATETLDGLVEPQVKVGDLVIFGQFTGTLVAIGRDKYVICKEHDLLTIVSFDTDVPPEVDTK